MALGAASSGGGPARLAGSRGGAGGAGGLPGDHRGEVLGLGARLRGGRSGRHAGRGVRQRTAPAGGGGGSRTGPRPRRSDPVRGGTVAGAGFGEGGSGAALRATDEGVPGRVALHRTGRGRSTPDPGGRGEPGGLGAGSDLGRVEGWL